MKHADYQNYNFKFIFEFVFRYKSLIIIFLKRFVGLKNGMLFVFQLNSGRGIRPL